jgi:hypothetical protein
MSKLYQTAEDIITSIGSIFIIHLLNIETVDLIAKAVSVGCQLAVASATIYGIIAKIKENNKKEE